MPNLVFSWWPAIFLLLAVIPIVLFANRRQKNLGFLHTHMASVIHEVHAGRLGSRGKRINWWIIILWSLLIFALMRPQFVGKPIEIQRDGRSIMLVLDISESMNMEDLSLENKPTDRLTIAQSVLAQFIDQRRNDQIGLVVFGSESFLHAPLSFDHETIKRFLFETRTGFAGPRTAIGEAIGLAVKKLTEMNLKDRVVILLTDGQNNAGILSPEQATALAQKQNVKLYIVGVGASSMMVEGFFGKSKVNPSQDLEAAEPELKRLAQTTGGQYFRAKDSSALTEIYGQIDRLEPSPADPLVIIPKKELFLVPLMALLFLLFFRFIKVAFFAPSKVR